MYCILVGGGVVDRTRHESRGGVHDGPDVDQGSRDGLLRLAIEALYRESFVDLCQEHLKGRYTCIKQSAAQTVYARYVRIVPREI